jgi:ABC-type dipeptide/oligopeptide/nickel transport system permease component
MRQYFFQRLLSTVPVLLGVITLVFFLMRVLPGDPVAALAAQSGGSSADVARLRAEYGLDRPVGIQYLSFLIRLASGDLGRSVFTGQSVSQIIAQQAPETISLACAAIAVAIVLGLPLGVVAAVRQDSLLDRLCLSVSVLSVSVPIALSGLIMVLVFSLTLDWLPASGQGSLRHLVMPAMVMGLTSAGSIVRVVRTQLIEVLHQDYISVTRAKGLSEGRILVHHALRNALIPVLTLVGLQFGFMLGGAAITESVFARQGLGRTLVDAILYQDYPVVQGIVIVSAALYTSVNLIVDLAHYYLDPRINY